MEEIIKTFKLYIDRDKLEAAQLYYAELINDYDLSDIPMDFVFQKIYIHACLKKRHQFAEWLKTCYESMDTIDKIAIRQVFSYGKFLLNK